MSLYGHTNISIEALKRWVNTLSIDTVEQVDIGGRLFLVEGKTREILEIQLVGFSKMINTLTEGQDWRECEYVISPMFYNAFIRVDNSSIKIADYFECLIVSSNMKTYKKIIQGFDYIDVGAIHIRDEFGKRIATIGEKSDLIWTTFFEYFVNYEEDGSINHTYHNHEQYLSIQLFDVENLSQEELMDRVNEILLRVSMEYDMDFKIFSVDPKFKEKGECKLYEMTFAPTGFERFPMFYLNNAINSSDERLSFLSYYQTIEYFFVRAQNYYFLDKLSKIDIYDVEHNKLRKVLTSYKQINAERETLKLVFTKAIDISKFKIWITSNKFLEDTYCNSSELNIDIQKEDKKIINALVERVYSYRCSIAHAKGDVEEYIAIPLLSKTKIQNELPLLKYLAFEVVEKWSEC